MLLNVKFRETTISPFSNSTNGASIRVGSRDKDVDSPLTFGTYEVDVKIKAENIIQRDSLFIISRHILTK
jgi:hypothetical protein